ncbi:hypothetical protein EIP91_003870 [Steccherinum ochraceum]|uniref:Uncharacterized protein n=1 Tax=Steccherinum ochraceum TaxID=92696 RepID=A0A4R0RG33_9APHY|nr:hypothetical protein EIP91_003870 [Steccherinum ochraceum]
MSALEMIAYPWITLLEIGNRLQDSTFTSNDDLLINSVQFHGQHYSSKHLPVLISSLPVICLRHRTSSLHALSTSDHRSIPQNIRGHLPRRGTGCRRFRSSLDVSSRGRRDLEAEDQFSDVAVCPATPPFDSDSGYLGDDSHDAAGVSVALLVHPWICEAKIVSVDVAQILGLCASAAFSTLRIWAIWNKAIIPTLLVFVVQFFVPAVNIYNFARPFVAVVADVPIITRAVAIAGDVLVLGLTWTKTAYAWRASRKGLINATISTVLIQDGTLYFTALLVLNIVTLLTDVFQRAQNGSTAFIVVVDAISSNLIARFILDLRVDLAPTNSRTVSSIRFNVRSLAGNIGAPLESFGPVSVSESAGDIEQRTQPQENEDGVIWSGWKDDGATSATVPVEA